VIIERAMLRRLADKTLWLFYSKLSIAQQSAAQSQATRAMGLTVVCRAGSDKLPHPDNRNSGVIVARAVRSFATLVWTNAATPIFAWSLGKTPVSKLHRR
jgi:hypothetical protein